jgi:glutamate/tyrosine decarboxylase-like PLP-dependent enzyme
MKIEDWMDKTVAAVRHWEARFGSYQVHPSLAVSDEAFEHAFDIFVKRLDVNYPYFHPSYAGQMLKPPHPAAIVGYFAAMLINPNNHALDAGPATAEMEKDAVRMLAEMFGYQEHLGHLTSSGTIANLEALFVARELHPDKGVAYSADAHYTHGRMCHLLGIPGYQVSADSHGRLDLEELEQLLRSGEIGTVVLTAGTTGLGAVDPIAEVAALQERYDVRLHVDAAYGGFFRLIAAQLPHTESWEAIARCDSIAVDPHKHGLQPYGCGAVLFADSSVGRFYLHDSPYTYFTSQDLHLGEISLECSRAGAAAAALWLTFQVLPPTETGLGRVLSACRRAALDWAELINSSSELTLYQTPDLDIVTYLPNAGSMSAIAAESDRILKEGMAGTEEPIYLSTLRVHADELSKRNIRVNRNDDQTRILRSVLMKPESEHYIKRLHTRLHRILVSGT